MKLNLSFKDKRSECDIDNFGDFNNSLMDSRGSILYNHTQKQLLGQF
jgi:hypothetical protein